MLSDDQFNDEWYSTKQELEQAVRGAVVRIQETGRVQWPKSEVHQMLKEIIEEVL